MFLVGFFSQRLIWLNLDQVKSQSSSSEVWQRSPSRNGQTFSGIPSGARDVVSRPPAYFSSFYWDRTRADRCPLFSPSALVWLHLTLCEIRTRSNSRSSRASGWLRRTPTEESGWKTSCCVVCSISERSPCNVTLQVLCHWREGELFWFSSPVGRLTRPRVVLRALF